MFKIKIIVTLLLLAGAAGGFAYVQKLRADNAVLKINQEKLETALSEQQTLIETLQAEVKTIKGE